MSWAYIGRCPGCGNVPCVTVDKPEYAEFVRKDVAQFMKYGLVIERVNCDEGVTVSRCTCKNLPNKSPINQSSLPLENKEESK